MVWSVAARFGFDCLDWTVRRLEFYYRGHVALHAEEVEAIKIAREAAKNGRN